MISRSMRYLFCVVLLLMLSSCGLLGSDDSDDSKSTGTLADLEPAIMPEKNPALPQVNLDALIEIYNDVLTATTEPGIQIQVYQRLAGLEMKRSESNLFDNEESGQFDLAISAYQRLIDASPDGEKTDRLRYQLSKAYDLSGNSEKSMQVLNDAVTKNPDSVHYGEIQFRRAEIFFSQVDYRNAELAYAEVIKQGEFGYHYKNSLYMHGWSLFKQQRYRDSLASFILVLDVNITEDKYISVLDLNVPLDNNLQNLKRSDRELSLDVLRVMSVVFSYLDGPKTITQEFSKNLGERHYMPLVYAQLGKLYLKKERFRDSADTYRAFVTEYPLSDQAPVFYGSLIDAYVAGAFVEDVLREKEQYIENYGFSSEFWLQKNESARNFIRPFVKKYLPELARYHHARAQANANVNTRKLSKKKRTELQLAIKAGFVKAGDYYQEFIDTFPVDDQVPEIQFLMAESRFEAGNLEAAIDAYEVVAYRYSNNKRGPEAGYSAIVSYEALLKNLNQSKPVDTDTQETWLRLKIESQLRFSDTFVDDKRSDAVLVKSSEELLELAEYRQARDAAQKLIRKEPVAKKAFRKTAWLVIGHSQFELESYNNAEQAYQKTLELLSAKDPKRKAIKERLAASVYKQGEQALAGGFTLDAADQFLRVATVAPGSAISITAQFDAANALLASSSWVAAIDVLDKFQRNYPNNKLSKDVPAKLVVAYQGSGQWSKAAAQLTSIYNGSSDDAVKRESLYQAAEYYEKAGDISSAIDRYRSYAHTYPEPFPVAMEARFKLSEFYLAQGEGSKRRFWLKKMMAADKNAGTQRNDRSRYLAAFSSNVFANDNYQAFKAIPLKLPLKRSLKRKKKALNKALVSYATLSEYAVQEFSTLATYRIASIYQQLSVDLMASERPRGLDELALEEYAILLEEQAFPFEEKSISIHETNTQRSWQGTYDEWIEQSFSSLKTLLPARYGKNEGGMTFDNEIY